MKRIYFLLSILLASFTCIINSQAQDLLNMPLDYYKHQKTKDGLIFTKKGNTYKVKNNKGAKGICIKIGNKWLRHGIYYQFLGGKISKETRYVQGKKEGVEISYRSNGQINKKTPYANDKRQGVEFKYFDDGSLDWEWGFKNDLSDGEVIRYANGPGSSTGKVSSKWSNKLGKRHGKHIIYRRDGQIKSVTIHNMGEFVKYTPHY